MVSSIPFKYTLHPSRLGIVHPTLNSYASSIVGKIHSGTKGNLPSKRRYSLILVTESSKRRVLLGMKNRGFGTGFYNAFGGKIEEEDPTPAHAAVRELKEETNLTTSVETMMESFVGTLNFDFADNDGMKMYVYRLEVIGEDLEVEGCEEITPIWFEDWHDLPFHRMFADDSVWMPRFLEVEKAKFEGHFCYQAGGTATNSISDYYLEITGSK